MLKSQSNALVPSSHHAPSYYAATVAQPLTATPLGGRHTCDVCIIGGGFTGCAAALHLAKRGLTVIVLEQSRFGWGASGRNGGQVHVGLRRDQNYLEKKIGATAARELWELALAARAHLDELIATYEITCDYRPGLLHADHKARYSAATRRYVAYLQEAYSYATSVTSSARSCARWWRRTAITAHRSTCAADTCIRSILRSASRAPRRVTGRSCTSKPRL